MKKVNSYHDFTIGYMEFEIDYSPSLIVQEAEV